MVFKILSCKHSIQVQNNFFFGPVTTVKKRRATHIRPHNLQFQRPFDFDERTRAQRKPTATNQRDDVIFSQLTQKKKR
jgi:hypothetical protein